MRIRELRKTGNTNTSQPIPCGQNTNYNGNEGSYSYEIEFGTAIGEAGIIYDAYNVPDKFSISWNGQIFTTGYVGSTSYDQELLDAGVDQSEINTNGDGSGVLVFNKSSEFPTKATITVDAPLGGTAWEVRGICPGSTYGEIGILTFDFNIVGNDVVTDYTLLNEANIDVINLTVTSYTDDVSEGATVLFDGTPSNGQHIVALNPEAKLILSELIVTNTENSESRNATVATEFWLDSTPQTVEFDKTETNVVAFAKEEDLSGISYQFSEPWISLLNHAFQGDFLLIILALEVNNTGQERSATMTVTELGVSKQVVITQNAQI